MANHPFGFQKPSFWNTAITHGFVLLVMPLTAADPPHPPKEQTPINISRAATIHDPAPPVLTFNSYSGWDLKIENTFGSTESGLVIAQEWATLKATPCTDSKLTSCANYSTPLPGGPSVTVSGAGAPQTYTLQQFHFHAPAEHTINGRRPPMEVHFVHLYNNGCTPASGDSRPGLVVGAFIEESDGEPSPGLRSLFRNMEELPRDNTTAALHEVVNLHDLIPEGTYRWRYDGGLTAPTGSSLCGAGVLPSITNQLITGNFPEAVHWYLYDKPLYLSRKQIRRFQEVFREGNARAIKENKNVVYDRLRREKPE
jgi:carbonic anhydrase